MTPARAGERRKEMKKFRIDCDPIRFRDLYRVTRRGRNVRIEFFAPANTTGEWGENVLAGIVQGFTLYDGEPAGGHDIKVLQMVETAICQRMAYGDYTRPVSDSPEFELARSLAERRALLRTFISEHLDVLQDVDEEEDERYVSPSEMEAESRRVIADAIAEALAERAISAEEARLIDGMTDQEAIDYLRRPVDGMTEDQGLCRKWLADQIEAAMILWYQAQER